MQSLPQDAAFFDCLPLSVLCLSRLNGRLRFSWVAGHFVVMVLYGIGKEGEIYG